MENNKSNSKYTKCCSQYWNFQLCNTMKRRSIDKVIIFNKVYTKGYVYFSKKHFQFYLTFIFTTNNVNIIYAHAFSK